jgi:PTH1 family peptidyl-tRNA hydrolase
MYLIVGLGNPGKAYEGHRHNIGFMAIDAIAHAYGATPPAKKFHGELSECNVGGEKLLLLKPHTFMNLSGKAAQAALAFYKLPLENLIVLHDELDLPLEKLRIKKGGGANGHNGIKDIDRLLGADYWRVRLGIDHPGMAAQVHGYVLSNFDKEERPRVDDWMENFAKLLPLFWQHSPAALMSKLSPAEKKTATNAAAEAKARPEK